jgi:hypothetical protein
MKELLERLWTVEYCAGSNDKIGRSVALKQIL